MVLNDMQIQQMIERGKLVRPINAVFPSDFMDYATDLSERGQIQPASLDVTLGDTFKTPYTGKLVTLYKPVEYREFKSNNGKILITPHSFVLATTQEYLYLPDDITAFVEGRSSIGRIGLFVQNAGWVDPGFEGQITLELFNASDNTIELEVGRRLAQLVFVKMSNPCNAPYRGKYQGQKGATESRVNQDEEVNHE